MSVTKTISANGSHGHHTFTLTVTETAVNTSANTSTCTVKFTIKPYQSGYNWEDFYGSEKPKGTVTFNGTSYSWELPNYNGTSTVTLVSKTVTVAHASDGTKTVSFSFSCSSGSTSYLPGSASKSGSLALTSIARYPSVSVSNTAKTETAITMKWTSDLTANRVRYRYSSDGGSTWSDWVSKTASAKSGSYTLSSLSANTTYTTQTEVRSSESGLITTVNKAVKTYNWPYATVEDFTVLNEMAWVTVTNPLNRSGKLEILAQGVVIFEEEGVPSTGGYSGLDEEFLTQIPNSMTGQWAVRITYGEHVSTSASATYSAAGFNPSFSGTPTYADANTTAQAIIQNNQTILQNIGTPRFTASGTAQYTATIASGKVTILGQETTLTRSGSNVVGTTGVINSATNVTATVTIIDSRGNSASQNVTVTMAAYTLPSAIITLNRKNNYYSLTDITVSADVMPLGSNVPTIKAKWKVTGTSVWSSEQTIPDDTLTALNGSTGLDNTEAWDVQITVSDSFGGSVIYNTGVGVGLPIFYIDRALRAVGINSFPETDKPLVVNGVDILGALKSEQVTPTVPTVSGVSVSAFQVYKCAGMAMVTVTVTLTAAVSNWTTVATGMPLPPAAWYANATAWTTSYSRNLRIAVSSTGDLNIRYGAATSYTISFAYPLA